jgi:hypothetical protein
MHPIIKEAVSGLTINEVAFARYEKHLREGDAFRPELEQDLLTYTRILAQAHHIYFQLRDWELDVREAHAGYVEGSVKMYKSGLHFEQWAMDWLKEPKKRIEAVAKQIGADETACYIAARYLGLLDYANLFGVSKKLNIQYVREKLYYQFYPHDEQE